MGWREWLAAGMGQEPSSEVVGAKKGIDQRGVRRARRMMRRGRLAPDPPQARLVVALARESQRQQSGIGLVLFFAALVIAWAWLSVEQLDRGHIPLGILWAGIAGWGTYALWVIWRERSNASKAELNNLRLLDEAGQPCPTDARPRHACCRCLKRAPGDGRRRSFSCSTT